MVINFKGGVVVILSYVPKDVVKKLEPMLSRGSQPGHLLLCIFGSPCMSVPQNNAEIFYSVLVCSIK